MKKWSIKTRLVLLHTGLMILVIGIMLAILFSISSREVLTNVQNTLEQRVSQAAEWIEYDGHLKFDKDLLELKDGVYLSVYEADDPDLIYGKIPYGFAYDLPFEDGHLRTISAGDTEYCVLDMVFDIEQYHPLVVRGIASVSDAEKDVRNTVYLALILSPFLLLLTAFCGYLLSRKALQPVARITQTVQKIQKEKDLSKRVQLGAGKDEIYTLAQTFDQLLDGLEAGIKREKQFTSDVAHELRTPISVVLMQCEGLLAQPLDEPTREQIQVIYRKVQSMSEMIAQLLMLSRADQGRAPLHMEQLDFSQLSQITVEEFTETARAKNISIDAQIQPGLLLTGDQTLLIRLWNNLLQNAIRYTDPGGHIRVSVRAEEQTVLMQVGDDGIGIAPEHLEHIWERFYQVDPSRSGGGSGLGLSLVQWIIQAHHAQIDVQSQPGKGTTFTCRFTRQEPPTA